jgi:DNA-binding response OmpR family regulator
VVILADHEGLQREIRTVLELAGLEVTYSGQPGDGIAVLQRRAIDLAVIDLPHHAGLVTVREIRQLGIRTPLCFLSSYGSAEFRHRALEAGCVECFLKPVDLEEFGRVIKGCVATSTPLFQRGDASGTVPPSVI